MTKNLAAVPPVVAGTIEGDSVPGESGSDRRESVLRAQGELIELLARLVLAAVEREQQHDAALDGPTLGPARPPS